MSEETQAHQQIEERRENIDRIDKTIVELLNERAEQVLAIRELKGGAHIGLYDPKREEEVIARACSFNEGPLYNDNLRDIYQGILKVMKEMPA